MDTDTRRRSPAARSRRASFRGNRCVIATRPGRETATAASAIWVPLCRLLASTGTPARAAVHRRDANLPPNRLPSPSPPPSPLPHSLLPLPRPPFLILFSFPFPVPSSSFSSPSPFLSRPSLFSLPTSFYSLCSSSFPHFLSFPSPLPSPLFQFSPPPPVRKQKSRKKKKINSLFQAFSSRRFPDDEPQSRGDGSKRVNTCAINALTRATCWQTT